MNQVLEQWERAAQAYAAGQEQNKNVRDNMAVVQRRFPAMPGCAVLDAGCGYGVFTDYFRRIGADVIGCDGSPAMLRQARARYPEGAFEQVDLQQSLPYADERFDLVFCNQVLMDLPEIESLFDEFARVLKTGGRLFCAIVHPAAYPGEWLEDEHGVKIARMLRSYAREYQIQHDFCGGTTHFHRPISYYCNLAAQSGLCLIGMEEPCAADDTDNISGMPLFLYAEWRKLGAAEAE